MLAADGVFCASAFKYARPPASSALPDICNASNTVTASAGRDWSRSRLMCWKISRWSCR
jgi:hypothetical protein